MKLIKEGDTVTVFWTSGNSSLTGIVRNVPKATGDMWVIENTDSPGGLFYVNPCCSNLETILKRRRHDGI